MAHHTYTVGQMTLCCQLVLACSISLRSVNRVLSFFTSSSTSETSRVPCWHTSRDWLCRLGYYKINRPKTVADDWIWIIDHSIQTGEEKCLIILGIRLSDLPIDRALTYEDVEPIQLLPVRQSNGEIVYQQLEAVTEKTGIIPRIMVGDKGPDIKSGIEKYCKVHKETSYIYDVKHKTASLLKRTLNENNEWETFTQLAGKTKKQLQQTALAALAPPKQRSKARYMNTECLLNWGSAMLSLLSQSDRNIKEQGYDSKQVKEKLGWLIDFKDNLTYWNDLLSITQHTEHFVRDKGLYRGAASALKTSMRKKLHLVNSSDKTIKAFKKEVLDFVKHEEQKAKPGERLLGSSEIIESVIGKQKFIENEQSKSGFTGLMLALGAIVSKTTPTIVKQAMETVPTKMVQQWYKEHITKSLQAKRVEVFKNCKKTEQKWNQCAAA